ncbi:TPA: EpsG family protein [Vibrio cholerae]
MNKYEDLGIVLISASMMYINVLLSIPILIYSIIKNSKYLSITIPLFFSIIAYNIIPTYEYDLYRIYENYQQYELFGEYFFVRDGFLLFLYSLIKTLGLSRELLPFIACFLIFYSKISFVQSLNDELVAKSKNYIFLFLCISLMSVPLLQFSGIRFSSAIAFLTLSIAFLNQNKTYHALLFCILAVFCHVSSLIFVLAWGLSLILRGCLDKIKFFLILTSLVIGFFSTEIVQFVSHYVDIVNSLVGWNFFSVETYITGEWGIDRLSNLNETGALVLNITKMIVMYFLIYTVIFLPNNKVTGCYIILISMALMFYQFGTLFDRISQFAIILMIYTFLKNTNMLYSSKSYSVHLFLLFSSFFIFRAIDYRNSHEIIVSAFMEISNLSIMHIILGG